jgi:hypothetical protein
MLVRRSITNLPDNKVAEMAALAAMNPSIVA